MLLLIVIGLFHCMCMYLLLIDSIGSLLCERVLNVLFDIWILSCAHCFPAPSLWKTLQDMCSSWRHHDALVAQWHRVNVAFTTRLLRNIYGTTPRLPAAQGILYSDWHVQRISVICLHKWSSCLKSMHWIWTSGREIHKTASSSLRSLVYQTQLWLSSFAIHIYFWTFIILAVLETILWQLGWSQLCICCLQTYTWQKL